MTDNTAESTMFARQLAVHMVKTSQQQTEQMTGALMEQLMQMLGNNAIDLEEVLKEWEPVQKEFNDAILEDLTAAYTRAIAQVYTVDELRDVLAFVNTPSGESFFAKQGLVAVHILPDMMEIMQKHIPALEAKLNEIFGDDNPLL